MSSRNRETLVCPVCMQSITTDQVGGIVLGTRCGCPEKHWAEQDREARERDVRCTTCHGEGWVHGDCHPQEVCGACNGFGKLHPERPATLSFDGHVVSCDHCGVLGGPEGLIGFAAEHQHEDSDADGYGVTVEEKIAEGRFR